MLIFILSVRMSLQSPVQVLYQYKQHKALPINLIQGLCGLKPTAVILTDSAVLLGAGAQGHLSFCRLY